MPDREDAEESGEPDVPPAGVPGVTRGSRTDNRLVRQHLDLPASDYDRLQHEVRLYTREVGHHSRDLNVEFVLRALVRQLLEHPDRDNPDGLWRSTFDQACRDADARTRRHG